MTAGLWDVRPSSPSHGPQASAPLGSFAAWRRAGAARAASSAVPARDAITPWPRRTQSTTAARRDRCSRSWAFSSGRDGRPSSSKHRRAASGLAAGVPDVELASTTDDSRKPAAPTRLSE